MELTADYDVLAPGESVTHVYTVTPRKRGRTSLGRATVEYSYIEEDSEDELPGRVFSSALYVPYGRGMVRPGRFRVKSRGDARKSAQSSNHALMIFWAFMGFNTIVPFYLYSKQSATNKAVRLKST